MLCLSFGTMFVGGINKPQNFAEAQSVIDLDGTDLNGAVLLDDSNKLIPSKSYICADNNGYDMSTGDQRYMFRKNGQDVPYLNFFVDTVNGGQVLRGNEYNGYDSYGYIVGEGEPVYATNPDTGEIEKNDDGEDKLVGYRFVEIKLNYNFNSRKNILGSDGRLWSISDDSWKDGLAGFPTVGVVGQGALIVQKFVPNKDKEYPTTASDWNILNEFNHKETFGLHTVNFFNEKTPEANQTPFTVYQPKGEDLQKGVFVRLTVAYEVKNVERTYQTIRTRRTSVEIPVDTVTYKNVVEQTTFYICNTSAEVVFQNIYFTEGSSESGENKSETKLEQKGGAISNNQGSKDGFKLDLRGNNFDVKYKFNDSTNYMNCEDGQVFVNTGKYEFLITTKIGLKRTKTVYVHEKSNDANLKVYFGDGLVKGGRVFAPTDVYPVYVKDGIVLSTQDENAGNTKHAPLVGRVYKLDSDWDNVERGDDGLPKNGLVASKNKDEHDWQLSNLESGNYEVVFANNEDYFDGTATGDTYVFVWKFSVVDNGYAPVVNRQALDSVIGISDYESLHYEVVLPTLGTGNVRVVFAEYSEAYTFASKYYASTVKTTENGYIFDGVTYQKERDMIAVLHEKAKQIVEKKYFDLTDVKSYTTLKENIIVPVIDEDSSDEDKKYYENFVNILNRELNYDVLVFNSENNYTQNAIGLPFLNDREYAYVNEKGKVEYGKTSVYFVSVSDYETNKVTLVHKDSGKSYVIPYGVAVQKFLELNNAPSGEYSIVEENYCEKTEYDAVYIRKGDITSVLTIERVFNNTLTTHVLNKMDSSIRLRANNVVIKDIENTLDSFGLIKIVKVGEYTHIYQIDEVSDIPAIDEEGNYEIVLIDRLGNSVKYYIDIFTASKIYDFKLVDGNNVVLSDNAYGGKAFELPVLPSPNDTFEFGGWQDENGNIYNGEYVFNMPKNITLTAVWNYANIAVKVYDGVLIASYNQKVGRLQALPKLTKDGNTLFGYRYILSDGKIRFYRGQINYIPNVPSMRLDAVWIKNDVSSLPEMQDGKLAVSLVDGDVYKNITGDKTGKIKLPQLDNTTEMNFAGWLYVYELSGYIFTDEMTFDEISQIGMENEDVVKLNAIWLTVESNAQALLMAGTTKTGGVIGSICGFIMKNIGTISSISLILFVLVGLILKTKKSQNVAQKQAVETPILSDLGEDLQKSESDSYVKVEPKPKKQNAPKRKFNGSKFYKKIVTPCIILFLCFVLFAMSGQNLFVAIKGCVIENQVKTEIEANSAQLVRLNELKKEKQQKQELIISTFDMVSGSSGQTSSSIEEPEDDEKDFLYSLAIIDLMSFGFDDVFPAYAKVGVNTETKDDDRVVKGYAYTNYAQAFEEKDKIYFGAGFFSAMDEDHLSAQDIESGVELQRDTEYGDNTYNDFKLTHNINWGPYHYVAYEKYVNYMTVDYVLTYNSIDDIGVYDDALGDVYNYDIADYCHYTNYGSEFKFDSYAINQDVDYEYMVDLIKQIEDCQSTAGVEINVDKVNYVSAQALKDYATGVQGESVLGISAETLLYYEANIASTSYYVIMEDGTVKVLQFPPDPVKKSTIWEKIWMTLATAGVAFIGVIVCSIPGVGPILGGGIISAALDAFSQVVIGGVSPEAIDWVSVGISGVSGMLTGAIGLGAKSISNIALKGMKEGIKKFLIKTGINVLSGVTSGIVSYIIATPPELRSPETFIKAMAIGGLSGAIMTIGDQVLGKIANKVNALRVLAPIINGAASGASMYLLSCLITGNEFDLKSFLISAGIGSATALIVVVGGKVVDKIKTSRMERTSRRMQKAAEMGALDSDDIPVSQEKLKKRIKYLPGPKNKNWKICDVNGNVIDKNTLLQNNGNGIIVGKDGVVIPIKNGCPVFDGFSHATVKVPNGYGVNRKTNFEKFDNMLAEKWGREGVPAEYQKWFDNNGVDTDFLLGSDIRDFRTANKLVWHEHQNGHTAQLLDHSLHTARYGGIPHLGGISDIKTKLAQKEYELIKKGNK